MLACKQSIAMRKPFYLILIFTALVHCVFADSDRGIIGQADGKRRKIDADFVDHSQNSIQRENPDVLFVCSEDGLFSHPTNCGRYVKCLEGSPFDLSCPNEQHFDNSTRECKEPCDAHCDQSIACECGWDTCGTTEEPYAEVAKDSHDVTANPCLEGGLQPDPQDCGRFILCTRGRKLGSLRCPGGLHFDNSTRECKEPCDAHCDQSIACECGWATCGTIQELTPYTYLPATEEPYTEVAEDSDDVTENPCTEEGLHADPEDCGRFIVCSRGKLYRVPCAKGLHFSPQAKRCDWPSLAQCQLRTTNTQSPTIQSADYRTCARDGLFRNPRDCGTYIHCANGQKFIMPCPKGLHFSEHSRTCEQVCEARCNMSMAQECGWNGGSTTTPENDIDTCWRPPYQGPPCGPYKVRWYFDADRGKCQKFQYGGCPSEGNVFKTLKECSTKCLRSRGDFTKQSGFFCFEDGLFSNPENCATYIQCSDWRSHVMPCPEGLHFNEDVGKCEQPCHAHCDLSLSYECGWEEQEMNNVEKSPKYPESAAPYDFSCVSDGLHPNPANCSTYFRCRDGKGLVLDCPENQHFSPETYQCEPACEAYCDFTIAEECDWEQKGSQSSLEASGKALKQPIFDFRCWRNGLFKNYGNCSTYIQCTGAVAYLISCPFGLHFSNTTKKCEPPCEARCDPEWIEKKCGNEDKKPTPTTNEYDYTVFPEDDESGIVEQECPEDKIWGVPEDCTAYMECLDTRAHVRSCPPGKHFSEDTLGCEIPCEARCNMTLACECDWDECSDKVTEEIDCEVEPETGPCKASFQRFYYDVESGECRGFTYGGCRGNSNNFKTEEECQTKCQKKLLGDYRCPRDNGDFGRLTDCISYYHCKGGVPTLKRCPKGKEFDVFKSMCVPNHQAICVQKCMDLPPFQDDRHKRTDCFGPSMLERCRQYLRRRAMTPFERCRESALVKCW